MQLTALDPTEGLPMLTVLGVTEDLALPTALDPTEGLPMSTVLDLTEDLALLTALDPTAGMPMLTALDPTKSMAFLTAGPVEVGRRSVPGSTGDALNLCSNYREGVADWSYVTATGSEPWGIPAYRTTMKKTS
jgi:hypothetical protein